jgi:hypothetical protein
MKTEEERKEETTKQKNKKEKKILTLWYKVHRQMQEKRH